MTKLLVVPTDKNNIIELSNKNISGFIIGLKGYSVFTEYDLTVEEIKELIKLTNKEIFIAINKPLYVDDIDKLKPIISELLNLNIKGIIFDDIGLVNLLKDEKIELIWNQMHQGTNYQSCNYWLKRGINGALLSTEIMLKDIIDIKNNTTMKLLVYAYGYLPMFESSRELLSNYFEYKGIKKDSNNYNMYEKEREKYYKIYEKNNETYILEDLIDGIEEINDLKDNKIEYIIVSGLMHKSEDLNIIVDQYIDALEGNCNRKSNNKGFFYKETIYKVKNE